MGKPAKQLQDAVHLHVQGLARQRRIRTLAEGLSFALGIEPLARNLVVWLAPHAHNNRDAVVAWIGSQLEDVQAAGDDTAVLLRRRLMAQLNTIQEDA